MNTLDYYANGKWHKPASGQYIDSIDPATGQVWVQIPRCNETDVNMAVTAAHQAFDEGPWGKLRASQRGKALAKLGDLLIEHADELGEIETRDNGKKTADITPGLKSWLADSFYYYAGLADKIEGAVIPVDAPNILNYTRHEPFGAVACITAWNSPLLIAIWKIAPALAAGNTIVIKPSEFASASTLKLMEVFEKADLPPGVLNVVTGLGEETGSSLVNHPSIRLVSFTGGLGGGAAAATAAAGNIKPVIMELGGKSPQLVFNDADIELAAHGVAAGIFPPGGQSCISGSRLLVQADIHDVVVEKLIDVVSQARLGHPAQSSTQIGPIAHKGHFECILRDIETAKSDGATLAYGGNCVSPDNAPNGYFIEPTIFTDVSPQIKLARDEVFGPVLAVLSFDSEQQAVAMANDTKFGLAAGIWSQDTARAIRIADQLKAGTIYINNYFNATTQSPVGGYKQSGFGRENGIEGMKAFMQTKSVWLDTKPSQPNPFES